MSLLEQANGAARGGTRTIGTRLNVLLTISVLATVLAVATPLRAGEIAGRWISADETTGRPRAVIEIHREQHRATGAIVQFLAGPGDDAQPVCERCEGERHGRPIVGMTILDIEADATGDGWHGKVLDPEQGRVYRCTARVDETGRMLLLRGYVGVALFGRTETWTRSP